MDAVIQLFSSGKMSEGIFATVYMTVIATVIAYAIGLPLGVILYLTKPEGLKPNKPLNLILGLIINVFRSIPFAILMVAFLPLSKLIIGTSIGNGAMIIMLVIASAPYVARMTESAFNETPKGVIEAAESMGANTFTIVTKVLIAECKPSLITGFVISTISILGYSALSSTIGGTGLGEIALVYGHQKYNYYVIWVCVAFIVLIVQIIQELGTFIAKRSDKRISYKKRKL